MTFQNEEHKKEWVEELSRYSSYNPTGPVENFEAGRVGDLDPLARRICYYTNRWACLMEDEVAKGRSIADSAKETRDVADPGGETSVTVFMHDQAIHMLSSVWVYGAELGKWWNRAVLGEKKGDQITKKGGLVCVSSKKTPMGNVLIVAIYRDLQNLGIVP